MPNKKSAKKELRKGGKRNEYNVKIKETLKSSLKKARKSIEASDAKKEELVKTTLKLLDKAAQKGVIKNNARDRYKSRLHLKLNKSSKK